MSITFGPAQSRPKKILGAVAGGTGAGKTYSALELGTGLVADPSRELFLIDTEFGRAAHYANAFRFQYGELCPPFRPDNYINAIESALSAGAKCVIVDSLSHMWEGEDGLLDWHGALALKMARGNPERAEAFNFPAWREPKQELTKFVLYIQSCPVHLILCLRAKVKSKMVKAVDRDGRSKTEIVDAGLQPIIDTATPYEATFLAMLSQDEPGVPHWTHKALASYLQHIFADGPKMLSRVHGNRLSAWCDGAKADVAQSVERPPLEQNSTGAKPAAGASVRERAQQIAEVFRSEQTLEGLNRQEARLRDEISAMPDKAKTKLAEIFHECRQPLMPTEVVGPGAPQTDAGGSFDDDIKDLEPDEWRKDEGRVEDDRQAELLS